MTCTAAEMMVLREAVAFTPLDHVTVVRIEGDGAFALLDRLSTAALYLREGQMRRSLFLGENGRPFADVHIASDEGGFFLLAEGPTEAALLAHIEQWGRPAAGAGVSIEPLGASHVLWGLNGPYAWEVASALFGPSVLGMTYLTLLPTPGALCFRGGKTGEYGYDLLVPRDNAAVLRGEIDRVGQARGLGTASLAALDQAALENWQFSIRTLPEGQDGNDQRSLTPVELQLQWCVDHGREFVGAPAVRARRVEGPTVRATCFTAAAPVPRGAPVIRGAETVGQVMASGWSHTRGDLVGIALLETKYAHPWIDAFAVSTPDGPVPLRTRTPPLLNNRSLHVDPHRHVYQARAADAFPPLVIE